MYVFSPPACQEERHASSVMVSFYGCSHCVCACLVCVSTLSCVSTYCALSEGSRPRPPLKQLVVQPRWLGTHEISTPRTTAALYLPQSDARRYPHQGMRTRIAPMGVCVCACDCQAPRGHEGAPADITCVSWLRQGARVRVLLRVCVCMWVCVRGDVRGRARWCRLVCVCVCV